MHPVGLCIMAVWGTKPKENGANTVPLISTEAVQLKKNNTKTSQKLLGFRFLVIDSRLSFQFIVSVFLVSVSFVTSQSLPMLMLVFVCPFRGSRSWCNRSHRKIHRQSSDSQKVDFSFIYCCWTTTCIPDEKEIVPRYCCCT